MRPDTFIDSQSAGPDRANRRGFSRGLPRVLCVPVLVVFYYVFTPFEKPAPAGQGNTNKQKRKEGKKAKKHRKKPRLEPPAFGQVQQTCSRFERVAKFSFVVAFGIFLPFSLLFLRRTVNRKPKTEKESVDV